MKRKYLASILAVGLIILVIIKLNLGNTNMYRLEKESLDLSFIINKVDELGQERIQLDWQEIVAVLAVRATDELSEITEEALSKQAAYFIEDDKVVTFETVLKKMEFKSTEKKRAYDNLEQLKDYGYTPNKTDHKSMEMKFIEAVKPGAIENYQLYGILPSITIAQAILESNWGASELVKSANNLFGIKEGFNWSGEVIQFKTKEGFNDYITDEFRVYPSLEASIVDHGLFLVENARYTKSGVFNMKTYLTQAKALEDAGYSTAEDEDGNKIYASMLGELIRQYNLQLIDHKVLYG